MTAGFAEQLRRLRADRGLSVRQLAAAAHCGKSHVHDLETGRRRPTEAVARGLDDALGAAGRLARMLSGPAIEDDGTDEVEAIELARRVTASDVSSETLDRLEQAADAMAMAYATTPPDLLLPRVRRHLDHVTSLVDARKTLDQHRRLLVVGGWLALLRATLHIDLRQEVAADAYLHTAGQLADQAEHREIAAWRLETKAWDLLTSGDFRRALQLSQHAQHVAPRGSSALVQATAQEGRAWARLGDQTATRRVLDQVGRLADQRPAPEHPEHHYQYDPAKARSYAATTLAWAGDRAAEAVAREVIAELEADGARPRRVASAHLDLGLALLAADKPDEAAAAAGLAITSGRIVPSNWWRAREVVTGVRDAGLRDAGELREAYEAFRPQPGGVVAVPDRR
jgi:transcriptional regulator with XRE-family HTH domain